MDGEQVRRPGLILWLGRDWIVTAIAAVIALDLLALVVASLVCSTVDYENAGTIAQVGDMGMLWSVGLGPVLAGAGIVAVGVVAWKSSTYRRAKSLRHFLWLLALGVTSAAGIYPWLAVAWCNL